MSLNLESKPEKIKTSIDIDSNLFKKAQEKMKLKNHTLRMIVEAALKQYLGEK